MPLDSDNCSSLPSANQPYLQSGAVQVDDVWQRCQIMSSEVNSEGDVEVLLVDTGAVNTVAMSSVMQLDETYTSVPLQAVHVSLDTPGPHTWPQGMGRFNLFPDKDDLLNLRNVNYVPNDSCFA